MTTAPESVLMMLAVAPGALGGVRLRGPAGPQREAWLDALRAAQPGDRRAWRRLPPTIGDDHLYESLDAAASLAAGHAIRRPGLLAEVGGGGIVVPMAERLDATLGARLAGALDAPQGPWLILLDEGRGDDPAPPAAVLDRLALELDAATIADSIDALDDVRLAEARSRWRAIPVETAQVGALVAAAEAFGVASLRAPLLALTAARVGAAWAGRAAVAEADLAQAVQLVIVPRATRWPAPAPDEAAPPEAEPPEPPCEEQGCDPAVDQAAGKLDPAEVDKLADRVLAAALARLPPDLLQHLAAAGGLARRGGESGRSGERSRSRSRGRVIGADRGRPRGAARLAVIETLRAAVPWQALRRRQAEAAGRAMQQRVLIRPDDLRIERRVQRRGTVTIFAIDASGSQALHRLAEAKGAVELLLADCYARRDRVAVIGFRGAGAELLLTPTRSLVMARRRLSGLPGGGGTPLAAGIEAAASLASSVRRAGATPLLVLLTDGRANIGLKGEPGRDAAKRDALAAARRLAASATASILIDTGPQASTEAAALAAALRADCIALPHADARALSAAVGQRRGA
jgi:magnesium chelatase subunit D